MRENTSGRLSNHIRRAAMAIIASGIVVVPTVQAKQFDKIVLVAPTELPESARQPGDAMLLHDADDGRTILYVEQNHGAQLAVFDVTDPRHVKSYGSVQLGAPGPFDFVSPLGRQKELVRFRQDQVEAVLDLRRARLPNLRELQGRDWHGAISLLSNEVFTVSAQAVASPKAEDPQPIRDYQVFDTAGTQDLNPVLDVKQVREELTKQDTGTTFLLTEGGLYLVRRPLAESEKRRREQEWLFQHAGAGG